jgi:ABC-type multidrug transport system fused ATPase/permease subunit
MHRGVVKRSSYVTLVRSFNILTKPEKLRIFLTVAIQLVLSVLDLIGVALIGMLGSIAVSGIGSKAPGNRVSEVLQFLQLDGFTLQTQASILGIGAITVLVIKTLVSFVLLRKTSFFLGRRGAVLSSRLVSKMLSQSIVHLQERSRQRTLYLVTSGVDSITMGVLAVSVQVSSDAILLLVLAIGLIVVDPAMAISSFLVFSLIVLLLYRLLAVRSQELGEMQAELSVKNSEKTLEVLSSYRELFVRNRRGYYSEEIGKIRLSLAENLAERAFMPNISKYLMEITVLLGSFCIAAVQFVLNDATRAITILSVFFAASTRIVPAILRIQQGSLTIRGSLGSALPTLELIDELEALTPIKSVENEVRTQHTGFEPHVKISNLKFKYPNSEKLALDSINLEIPPGTLCAFVGPSGAGKTTLTDVLLGILEPLSGHVTISGESPEECIQRWPGAMGYVPQDVLIVNGTVRENIALGFPKNLATDDLVTEALILAQLLPFVSQSSDGVDSYVGDSGTRMSGGQRQRLGIARALFTRPKLLVLDEATSSLDGETESNISDALRELKGEVTVILIAHRLSTVINADLVVYIDNGRVVASGSFQNVRKQVPDFDRQAVLMGL